MKITSLQGVSPTIITASFNLGFSDYVVNVEATEEHLLRRLRGARVSWRHSAGGWLDGQLVALLILGVDQWEGRLTAFNAATCVAPGARGRHFTTRAYEFLVPGLREINVSQLLLEVVQGNKKAIPVYQRVGFSMVRELSCFSGDTGLHDVSINPSTPGHLQILESPDLDLKTAESFHDFPPAWEACFAALKNNWNQYDVIQVTKDQILKAYGMVNKSTGQVVSFGVHPQFRRRRIGTWLFSEIALRHPVLKINNVDSRNRSTLEFLRFAGFRNVIDQFEMAMDI